MTLQTVSVAADLAMLGTAVSLLALAAFAAVQVLRGRLRAAAAVTSVGIGLIAAYAITLIGVALASTPTKLRAGDAKCFDDWCVALLSTRQDSAAGTVLAQVEIQNRGRGRAMHSDLARAYLELQDGEQLGPSDPRPLQATVAAGQRIEIELAFPAHKSGVARFVVYEGNGGPGPWNLEIGGEGSPFHPRAGWPVRG